MKVSLCQALAAFLVIAASNTRVSASDDGHFTRDVRPILSEYCFACHGPDEQKREADLRLDSASSATESGAVVPGDLDASELWSRITTDDADIVMPPPEFGKTLSDAERQTLKSWIESGAEFEQHWAFVAPQKAHVPDNGEGHPIDAFLKQRLIDNGLEFSKLADRRTLIRRATLDLTGLPPTPDEVREFLADSREDAYGRLIDKLMSRVAYGEHMARYWLDLARYADTHGLHLDNERSMWAYRDWVVKAFNRNMPFDEFTRWQLAGDLFDGATEEQRIASGFNRCNVSTSEGGSINEEWIFRYAVDRTTTMSEVWMGITAGCAVCHDHKFDPLSSKDYYSLYAFFHSAADPAMDGNRIDTPPVLKLFSAEDRNRINVLQSELVTLKKASDAKLESFEYIDPATVDPPPEPITTSNVWFEDEFPAGAKLQSTGEKTRFVGKEDGVVFSGERSIFRKAKGIAQDFYDSGAKALIVPSGATIFVYCYLDPEDAPDTIMIQFHTGKWSHRAVWGEHEKISWGTLKTGSKRHLGALPKTGEWVRLEVPASKLGLKAGAKVTGFAFTQFGGSVTWDHLGVETTTNTATDPAWSWKAWQERFGGKNNGTLPNDLRNLVRSKQPRDWSDGERDRVWRYWLRNIRASTPELLGELHTRQSEIESEIASIEEDVPITMVMADLPEPRKSFVMMRGQYDNPGEEVNRSVPEFLPPLPDRGETESTPDRRDLADWLVSGNHPLTSRVAVNRLWQQFFGTGIVRTSGDFGSQGEPPVHPELLDFLAVEFVEQGWDVQFMVKLIMTSRAYRQSSKVSKHNLEIDPGNRLLARAPRLRLDAEVLRDQVLFLSGLLADNVGGKAVKTYQPPDIWEPVGFGNSNTRYYKQDRGDSLYRKSLYSFIKRTAPPPFMSTFDAPNREQSCTRRERSNTPMQALQLMNDVQHVEGARKFASRILHEGGDNDRARIIWAWECVTAREPDDQEIGPIKQVLEHFRARFAEDPESARKLLGFGESENDSELDQSELAAYTMAANVLFNLDETVNKN